MHYPIKCPICLNKIENDDICYDMRDILGDSLNTSPGAYPQEDAIDYESASKKINIMKLPKISINDDVTGEAEENWDKDEDNWYSDDEDNWDDDDEDNWDDDLDDNISDEDGIIAEDANESNSFNEDVATDNSRNIINTPSLDECYETWNTLNYAQKEWTRAKFATGLVKLKYIKRFWDDIIMAKPIAVKVAPAYRKNNKTGDLEELFVKSSGSVQRSLIRKRYCPHCWNNSKVETGFREITKSLLHPNAGFVPTFIILLMGTSDAGKTVYLTMMYREMRKSPSLSSNIKFSIMHESTAAVDELNELSIASHLEELEKTGLLPPSTKAMQIIPPPLPFTVEVTNGVKNSQSLLYLRDIAGETLLNIGSDEIERLSAQFSEFDGFILLIDPKTFCDAEGLFRKEYENRTSKVEDGIVYFNKLEEVMRVHMSKNREESKIEAPAVVAITKGDLFRTLEHKERLRERGVLQNNSAIAKIDGKRRVLLGKRFYNDISRGTEIILEKLTGNQGFSILDFANRRFKSITAEGKPNVYYSLVSALEGVEIEDINKEDIDKKYRSRIVGGANSFRNNVAPDKVRESFEILLMLLNIIPPFHEISLRETLEPVKKGLFSFGANKKEKDATLQRKENNVKIMNEWREKYVVDWEEIRLREE